jgi:hypothetical protein
VWLNYQGQRCGCPHVASWAETGTVVAADLMAGDEDPRPASAQLLRRALEALPTAARAAVLRLRADAGYFAGELARAAHLAEVGFAIGARRIAPLWRILEGLGEATGSRRARWTVRRSPSPSTARTGGRWRLGC